MAKRAAKRASSSRKSTVRRKKRAYNNESRHQRVAEAQQRIIRSLMALLVERKGAEVGIDEIARRSKVSERTIFRFFKDKASLNEATNEYLQSFLQASFAEIEVKDVPGFARDIFAKFDGCENTMLAYIYSSFGRHARVLLREQFNEMIIKKIVEPRKLELTPERQRRLAVIVEMINVKLWHDIRNDFGFSGVEIGPAIEWAMNSLIASL